MNLNNVGPCSVRSLNTCRPGLDRGSTEKSGANGHTTLNAPGLVGSPKSKQRRVSLVPGWVTAWEYEMLLATILLLLLLLLLRAGFCLLSFADSCYCGAINERTAASPFFGLRRVDRRRTERRVAGTPAKVFLKPPARSSSTTADGRARRSPFDGCWSRNWRALTVWRPPESSWKAGA